MLIIFLSFLLSCQSPQEKFQHRRRRKEANDRWTEILPQSARFVRNDSNNSSSNNTTSYPFVQQSTQCESLSSASSTESLEHVSWTHRCSLFFQSCFKLLKGSVPSLCRSWNKDDGRQRSPLDEKSKVIFPISFMLFVGIYWCHYLSVHDTTVAMDCDFDEK